MSSQECPLSPYGAECQQNHGRQKYHVSLNAKHCPGFWDGCGGWSWWVYPFGDHDQGKMVHPPHWAEDPTGPPIKRNDRRGLGW